jgi:hypothetical protein
VATEQEKRDIDQTYVIDYSGRSATPTYYPYLADGGLQKADREEAAKAFGVKEADSDFEVVSDEAGRKLTVRVSPKEKAKA